MTFELALPSGRVLRTRVSRPANAETYGPALWSTILGSQLCVTEAQFWRCVDEGQVPIRETAVSVPASALPAGLAYQLIHTVGLSDAEVAALSREEAIARLSDFWSRPS